MNQAREDAMKETKEPSTEEREEGMKKSVG
jgi:hypothetical protein